MPSHNPESRYHRPHARAGNLFEDPPTNKPAVASGPLSSKDPDDSPCPRHMLQEATCCTENGNATTWISNLPTQLSATGLVLSSWVWTPSGPRPIVALPSPATVTRDTGGTSTGIGDAQLRIQVDKKETQCAWRECGPMGGWGRSLQLGTWPSPEGSSGARQAEFVRGPQVVNIHGVRPGREKPIGSRRARVNRRRSHHAARTWEDGGMECNLCPTELVVPMAGREGPRSNTRDRPGIRGFVSDGCWLLAARTARQQQQPARTCFRGRRGDSTRNHLKSQARPTQPLLSAGPPRPGS